MMSLARHIPQANASLKAGQWLKSKYTGIEVRNKTLGIIGLGNIGSAVARRAQGLEMKVIAFDPFVSAERAKQLMVTMVSLEELVQNIGFHYHSYSFECHHEEHHHGERNCEDETLCSYYQLCPRRID